MVSFYSITRIFPLQS